MNPIPDRIARLQAEMQAAGVQALLLAAGDPHVSEYPCEHWQGRRWASGFTGSLAMLVVLPDRAVLLPHAIYIEQATAQLQGSGIHSVSHGPGDAVARTLEWLPAQLPRGAVVAVHGRALALNVARQLEAALAPVGATLRADLDLLGRAWSDRPPLPLSPVFEHPLAYAATPRADKLAALRAAVQAQGATCHLVSSLEDIAWLTNLRGGDSPNTPVFLSHLLVDGRRARLFADERQFTPVLVAALEADGITLEPYDAVDAALGALGSADVLLLDPARVTLGLRQAVGAGCRVVEALNPSVLAKSRKSEGEAACIREAMRQDGAAFCELYAWFEAALAAGERVTEMSIAEQLLAARRRRPGFVMQSFPTIAGVHGHGAIPHYVATPETDAPVEGDGLLLIDSGAQFLGGTTDVTRVWPLGAPGAAIRRDVTMVLKAHIALTRLRFPRGTLSTMIDAVARAPMWREGLDYFHGTGHGVGYCLGVHEGPQTFRQQIPDPSMAMQPGMVTSIEPALYRPGQWGARIENLVIAVPADVPEGRRFGEFLEFETLTLCPIDTRTLEPALLTADERQWLDVYHATVRERLEPLVSGASRDWLLQRTQPL